MRWYSNANVLKMATADNAELLGVCGERNPYPGKIGVDEEGALADLLPIDGDPIASIELIENPTVNMLSIMKDGKIFKIIDPGCESFNWMSCGKSPVYQVNDRTDSREEFPNSSLHRSGGWSRFEMRLSKTLTGINCHARDQWLRVAQFIPRNIATGNGKQSLCDNNIDAPSIDQANTDSVGYSIESEPRCGVLDQRRNLTNLAMHMERKCRSDILPNSRSVAPFPPVIANDYLQKSMIRLLPFLFALSFAIVNAQPPEYGDQVATLPVELAAKPAQASAPDTTGAIGRI